MIIGSFLAFADTFDKVKQRAGNCLRYFKTGLNRTQDHELVLRVKDMGRLAVDWVEIYSVEGANV
jgi:hypothetical protein